MCIRHPLRGLSRVTDREGVLARGPEGPVTVVGMSPSQCPEWGGTQPDLDASSSGLWHQGPSHCPWLPGHLRGKLISSPITRPYIRKFVSELHAKARERTWIVSLKITLCAQGPVEMGRDAAGGQARTRSDVVAKARSRWLSLFEHLIRLCVHRR